MTDAGGSLANVASRRSIGGGPACRLQRAAEGRDGAGKKELGRFRMVLARATGCPAVERGRYLIVHVQSQGWWRWAVSAFGTIDEQHEQDITTST
jgi:hypothetical protein